MQRADTTHLCSSLSGTAFGPTRPLARRLRAGGALRLACQLRFPEFIPSEKVSEVSEPAALSMLARMQRIPISVPCYPTPVQTACVPPAGNATGAPPVVLLHGFDSSSLEFRRLMPELEAQLPVWAVDLAGWGFTDCGFGADPELRVGPQEKRQHLYEFWRQEVGQPMVLAGASLGGTIAMDFAIHHPEAVSKLVLLDPQATTDGAPQLPRPLAWLGVQLLKTVPLREAANKMAYFDVEQYATRDAMLIGRLHTHLPGWSAGNVAFIASGGYRITERLAQVSPPTLVMWGRHDGILPPANGAAEQVVNKLPNAQLVWAERSGHCPHLEEPAFTAETILRFVGVGVGKDEEQEGVALSAGA